jgi:oligoendopeptidase F
MNAPATYSQTWDLDSLAPNPDSDAFGELLGSYRDDLSGLANQADSLAPLGDPDPEVLNAWEQFLESLEDIASRGTELDAFIGCHAAADANNRRLHQLEAEMSALGPLRARLALAVQLGLQAATPEQLAECLAASQPLARIAYWLTDQRTLASLRLPRDQELLASELDVDGLHAWGRLYDRVSGALRITVMEQGELVERSPGQVQFDSADRSIRQNNYFSSLKAWRTAGDTCADALNHIAGTRLTKYRRLGLEDHLSAPLHFNRMQRETLSAMWAAVDDRKDTLLGFLSAKARLLGVDHLCWYDLQAPLPTTSADAAEIDYDTGCNLIIEAFGRFSPDFGEFARTSIVESWIEAENREGKRQGGFCTGFPLRQQSRIFMTYVGTLDSMSTLAHEIGHAYHSHVLREQPLFLQDYPMNLAETASTFAEAVLGEERLEATSDRNQQLAILDTMLSDSVGFLMNIHARFLFEDRFHLERAAGELSAERFSELMVESQQQAYLGALGEDGWNDTFWISKLHFYISSLPFYNFPYTFGYLLSLGLYALARESGGGEFPEQYRRFLLATGDRCTEDAVADSFGHDLRQPDFWNRSLDVVAQRVAQFESLAG